MKDETRQGIWAEACKMAVEIAGRVTAGADLGVEMATEFRGVMMALAERGTERDTLASQLAEAEATMDAYRGTIGQRERDVAALTAKVTQLEQEKSAETKRADDADWAASQSRELAGIVGKQASEIERLEQEKAEALAEREELALIVDGIKHDPRCSNHVMGDARLGPCWRCREEAAEGRIVELTEAVESAIAFLKSVEWVTNICEDDAFNIVEALRAALQPAAARAPEEPTT